MNETPIIYTFVCGFMGRLESEHFLQYEKKKHHVRTLYIENETCKVYMAIVQWLYTVPTTSTSMTSDINTTQTKPTASTASPQPSTEIKLCEPFIPAFTLYSIYLYKYIAYF